MFTEKEKKLINRELKILAVQFGSQSKAAEQVGATRCAYGLWLRGERKVHPKYLEHLKKLGCNIKNIRPDLADVIEFFD